ncbi:hypothetical protein LCGC14_2856600, partial [marine sediment metagenome]
MIPKDFEGQLEWLARNLKTHREMMERIQKNVEDALRMRRDPIKWRRYPT